MNSGNFTLEKIEVVENITHEVDLMKCYFVGGTHAYMFASYADILKYVDEEVSVSFRHEIIKGEGMQQVINTINVIGRINVLDRTERIKLYADAVPDTGSNVRFEDINDGDIVKNAIVYCTNHEYTGNSNASWAAIRIMDKRRKVAMLRLFDPEKKTSNFVGKYIKCDLIKKAKFGFNTQEVHLMEGISISVNPEVDIAEAFVLETIKGDEELNNFVNQTSFISAMKSYYYKLEFEVGFKLVELAMELAIANEFKNISPNVDTKLLVRGLVADKSYVLTNGEKNSMSLELQNIIKVSGSALGKDVKLLNILDANPPFEVFEKSIIRGIKDLVQQTLKAYKGTEVILSTNKIWRK